MIRRASRDSSVSLTEARTRLFRLVEDLLSGRTDRVTLSHRGHDEEVLLVRARDVGRMEEELTALRQRVAPEPRPLRGMATRLVPAEDVLGDARARQDALYELKMQSIFGDMGDIAAVEDAAPKISRPRPGTEPAGRRGGESRRGKSRP